MQKLALVFFLIFVGTFSLISNMVESPYFSSRQYLPKLVKKITSNDITGNNEITSLVLNVQNDVYDPLFYVGGDNIRLRRVVELCEWREESNTNNVQQREYRYTKMWFLGHQDDFSFHDKFGHENPIRNDVWHLLEGKGMEFTKYYNPERVLATNDDGKEILLSNDLIQNMDWFKSIVNIDNDVISKFIQESPASDDRIGFVYVGNGYFYSPFDEYSRGLTYRAAADSARYGTSNLDHLFKTCSPGDIRVRFEEIPNGKISVVGLIQQPKGEGIPRLMNVPLKMIGGLDGNIGLISQGIKTPLEMATTKIQRGRWGAFAVRGLYLFALMVSTTMNTGFEGRKFLPRLIYALGYTWITYEVVMKNLYQIWGTEGWRPSIGIVFASIVWRNLLNSVPPRVPFLE